MVKVKLISWSGGKVKDPRRLIVLATKVSSGKLSEKDPDYYLEKYPDSKVRNWILQSVKFPSVQEHIVFTFLIEDISRVTSHQLVRHRIASYTQESQRYAKVSDGPAIPSSIESSPLSKRVRNFISEAYALYDELISSGIPYEDARYILPQAVKTRILMTLSLRELLHIACLRLRSEAQWEIRELAKRMIEEASKVIPEIPELVRRACGDTLQ